MARARIKTLSYKRAVWLASNGANPDLEQLLRQSFQKLPKVSDRKFKRPEGQYLKGIRLVPERTGGCYIHIVEETPGDAASTLKQRDESKGWHEVDTAPPPAGSEYMDSDAILFVKKNNVFICATGLTDGALVRFCHGLFVKAGLGNKNTSFDLQKIAKANKMKMINKQGVKEIDLKATLYEASSRYANRKGHTDGALGVVSKHLNAMFGSEKTPAAENVSVSVVIKADSRKKGRVVGERRMKALAKDLIDEDSEYIIITKDNQSISPTEIFIRESVSIERRGKSVEFGAACQALKAFHDKLAGTGALSQ